jgi:DNA-binding MarR family transcriptional regulator
LYKRLKLTEREKQVLCLLLENKVMTRRQIVKQIFPNLDSGNITHRLSRLLNLGFLKDYQDRRFDRNDLLYELSSEGIVLSKSLHKLDFDQTPPRAYSYEHDVGLADLRQILENKESVEKYIPENVLQCCPVVREQNHFKSFVDMMSDAVLAVKMQGKIKTGALEFEPTAKWIERYREKVLNYYVKSDVGFVLYVCKSETTIQAIRTIENEIKPAGATKIYFSLFENVLTSMDKVIFLGRNQATLEIN